MKHGSLFSGIGGFDLAATWMGWENVFQCEKNAFCREVLRYYWPNTKLYEEIRTFQGVTYRGAIDVLTGGFPCQPFSIAGKRKGTADDRYLWPEMYRVIGEIRPRWIVGENVLGLLNWRRGLVFEQVQVDLETQGYKVWPFILPAAGVGAPHRRNRVWIVAYSGGNGCNWHKESAEYHDKGVQQGMEEGHEPGALLGYGNASDADGSFGRKRGQYETESKASEYNPRPLNTRNFGNPWDNFPTQSPLCGGDDGISGRLDRIALSKWRVESLRGAGNAIVPQVAFQIFKAIEKVENGIRGYE